MSMLEGMTVGGEQEFPSANGDCGLGSKLDSPLGKMFVGTSPIRTFTTGATRDTESGKLDYEGFLSPAVLEEFAKYMHTHRMQSNGSMRDSDNWQKGIPRDAYMKSGFRHFMDLWKLHRGYRAVDSKTGVPVSKKQALCAILFNVMGYLHEEIKQDG